MSKPVSYRPVAGRRALLPNGVPLGETGQPIDLTPYWHRLLADGDIEVVPTKSKPSERSKSA